MKEYKIPKIIITCALTIIEGIVGFLLYTNNLLDINGWWSFFLTCIAPVGLFYLINFYVLSPIIISISLVVWEKLGHYGLVTKMFFSYAQSCISWLNNTSVHWGEVNIAKDCQNANTCEGLLAMKKTGLDIRYKTTYLDTLNQLMNSVTSKGLISKSLQCETVVCTSMVLYLYLLESKNNKDMEKFKTKLDCVAKNLWDAHCNEGWGVYIIKPSQENCSFANTFWALRALNEYYSDNPPEYLKMLRHIYEASNNSLFGYNSTDTPRLCTTAMSVSLYYSLNNTSRQLVDEVYDVKKSVEYVHSVFCDKGVECEVEIINGLQSKTVSTKKGPWTHITIAFVTEALVNAYTNGHLSVVKMNSFIGRLKKICRRELMYVNESKTQCYYMPKGMIPGVNGIFTFPTSYMAWALGTFKL